MFDVRAVCIVLMLGCLGNSSENSAHGLTTEVFFCRFLVHGWLHVTDVQIHPWIWEVWVGVVLGFGFGAGD